MENKIGELNIKGDIVRIFLFEKIVNYKLFKILAQNKLLWKSKNWKTIKIYFKFTNYICICAYCLRQLNQKECFHM